MRVLNDEKYEMIRTVARDEFIRKGYKEVSMRAIATRANIGLSNIYNYFKSKDEIFAAVVKPAKDELYFFIRDNHSEKDLDFNRMSTLNYQDEIIDQYIQLIDKYRDEFRLLLFHADGSSLKDFRDSFTDYLTRVSIEHMAMIKKHYPQANDVSDFLIHTLSSWMVTILGEIVAHNLEKERIRDFFKEFFRFEIAGWRHIIGV